MATISSVSSSSMCSCLSQCVDMSESHELMQEVISDLLNIKDDLQLQMMASPDQTTRACKIQSMMVKLQGIDDRLLNIYNLLQSQPDVEEEEFVSNYGISVKLDMAKDKLSILKEKHHRLRKEWYSQDEHLNKLSKQINEKEKELREQSIFCTVQGLVFSKMLWKLSKADALLDIIVSEEKLILELVKVFGGCLYGFMHTYGNEMPQPSADEYQYVLCLCGLFSNLATVPDGRFLLISQSVCREVYDEMIKILPKIMVPNAENLKCIILTAIYNLMICKEGQEYAKNNSYLLQSLAECIKPPHTNRIITLALKIICSLTNKIPNKVYMKQVSSVLPVKRLRELQEGTDSCTIRKQARHILSSLMRTHQTYSTKEPEKLIGVTQLDRSKSKCQARCVDPNRKLLTYYVLTEPVNIFSQNYASTSSVDSQSRASSLTTMSFSTDSSSTDKIRRSVPKPSRKPVPHSARTLVSHGVQTSHRRWKSVVSLKADDSAKHFAEQATSTVRQVERGLSSVPTQSSMVSSKPLSQTVSEEIKCVQYQIPYKNLSKMFAVTVGDNHHDSVCNNTNTSTASAICEKHCTETDKTNASIVTVYQINNSQAILFSENSFGPVCAQTQTCSDATTTTRSFFKDVATNITTSSDFSKTNTTSKSMTALANTSSSAYPCLDIEYERSWYENLKSAWQHRSCRQLQFHTQKLLDLPSTSTGMYEFDRSSPYIVPIQEQFSPSANDFKEELEDTAGISCKTSLKKGFVKNVFNRKNMKLKKMPIYKVFKLKKKR